MQFSVRDGQLNERVFDGGQNVGVLFKSLQASSKKQLRRAYAYYETKMKMLFVASCQSVFNFD